MYIAAVSESEVAQQKSRPFRALLAAAVERPDAAYGLACAYSELPAEERRKLIDALIDDAQAERLELGAVLAPVCAVENDPELLALLVSHLKRAGVPPAVFAADASRQPGCRILLSGDAACGAAVIVRPASKPKPALALEPAIHDVLGLRWQGASGTLQALREQVTEAELTGFADRLEPNAPLEQSPVPFAAEVVAHALWQHLRTHGPLPEALADFADVIGPHAD
jgi:hypothetical protein